MRLAERLSQIWIKASVPTISLRGIELQLEKYIGNVQKVIRSKSATVKQDEIEKDLDTLFDICSCKCKELSSCCCPMVLKVPAIEHDFLTDQRTIRVGRIAGVDKKESARAERRLKRKSVSLSKEETAVKCARVVEASDNESDNETDNNSDTETYSPSVSMAVLRRGQMGLQPQALIKKIGPKARDFFFFLLFFFFFFREPDKYSYVSQFF